jgi:hypothetical protein
MLELKAGAFYQAIVRLTSTASWIDARSTERNSEVKDEPFHAETRLDSIDQNLLSKG